MRLSRGQRGSALLSRVLQEERKAGSGVGIKNERNGTSNKSVNSFIMRLELVVWQDERGLSSADAVSCRDSEALLKILNMLYDVFKSKCLMQF